MLRLFTKNRRVKVVFSAIGIGLIEGLIKTFITGFPLTEVFTFQGGVILAYITGKTINNAQEIKNGKIEPD